MKEGDFDHIRFNGTAGMAATCVSGHIAREFLFAEKYNFV